MVSSAQISLRSQKVDGALERQHSQESTASSNFTHRGGLTSTMNRSRSYTATSTGSSQNHGVSARGSVPTPDAFLQDSGYNVLAPLGDHELHQVMSKRSDGGQERMWEGDVGQGLKSANHQDISPWLFPPEGSAPSSAGASPGAPLRRETADTHRSVSQARLASPERIRLTSSQSYHSLRPSTPPSASTSTSTLNGSRDVSATQKKTRNPFGFLKKVVSHRDHAGGANGSTTPVSTHRSDQHVRPSSSRHGASTSVSPSLHSSTQTNAERHSDATSSPSVVSLRSSSHPTPSQTEQWRTSLASRLGDPTTAVLSLEDELEAEQNGKKDNRKRIKGVRHQLVKAGDKGRHADDDTGREGSVSSQRREVELSLDMNFDSMDDIVDQNAARQRLQGSITESQPSSPPGETRSPNGSEIEAYRTPSPSYTASLKREESVASTAPSSSHISDQGSAVRSNGRSVSGLPLSASASTTLNDRRPSQINMTRNNMPRLSLADAQNYQSLRKLSTTFHERIDGLPNIPAGSSLQSSNENPVSTNPTETQRSLFAGSVDSMVDYRKGSIVSAHSHFSNGSGISPKTSHANLPSLNRDRQKALAAANGAGWAASGSREVPSNRASLSYAFPAPQETASAAALEARKSSAGSGQGASSSWLAPDSWAVQPDKMFDYLRDDDQADEDVEDEGAAPDVALAPSQASSPAIAAVQATSMFRTSSSNPFSKAAAFGSNRRGTDESIDPLTVLAPRLHGSEDANSSKTDLGERASVASTTTAAHPQPALKSPTSRGGAGGSILPTGHAAAVAAAAATAAATKFGIHRPSKQRTLPRPSTAGSLGTTRPSVHTLGSSMSTEDDIVISTQSKRDMLASKRPPTAGNAHPTRNHFLRVYKPDGTFHTLTCSVTTTAADVQTILARKSMASDSGAYRLFVRDRGTERPLGSSDKPAQLQRRRLLQAGCTEADGLEDMGRDDLTYLLKFVFRPDSVMAFDSESIGNNEHSFQHLDLHGRNLEMVPIFLYKHADWILSLDLSDNPMSDLPLDFVQLCTNLRTLRLSSLSLKRIPLSVRHSETLTHLDVSNNSIVDLAHSGLDLIPELMSIKVQNNRLFDLPPNFASIVTLRYLNISNNRFDQFPAVICDVPSLVDLDISFNAITELPKEISRLVNLERFILAGNSLETLPDSMSELMTLRTIDLRRNLIQDISPLLGLPKLQNIQAESNSIKSFEATLGPQLNRIELGRNPLSKVSIAALTTCDLTSLDLSSTNMTRLDEGLFPQLPALARLTLDGNQLVVLPDSFGELTRLEMFSCNNNLLAALPDSIGDLKQLKELFVHNNNLKTLPQSMWGCEKLFSINVSSNLLESFPAAPEAPTDSHGDRDMTAGGVAISTRKGSTSSSMTQHVGRDNANLSEVYVAPLSSSLKKLRLGDNRLGDDVFSVMSQLHALEVLNLSFNEIFEIPDYTLTKLVKLRELYMSGNQLSTIPSDDLVILQELRILHLNGNKLTTLPAELSKLKKLANLDVGNNVLKYNIANWHYDWNWNMNPELRYLNLSGNTRLEIKTKLNEMDGTRKSNSSDFSRLTNLRLLGLMDVTMPLHSNSTPDESENRRVRTSLSQVNNMAYGIADALGKHDNLSVIDLVIPHFRKEENECVIALFDGHGHGSHVGSRIAQHLAEWSDYRLSWEVQQQQNRDTPTTFSIPDLLRRAFLRLQKDYADILINDNTRKLSEAQAEAAADINRSSAPAIAAASNKHDWRAGASAVLMYVVDKTLYVANAGDSLAVMSRNGGTAHLISVKHEPFDREETERIRSAEGWVSLRGYVNDQLDISRSFGYFHLFPIVNAAPAVTTVQLTDSDEFVIIANRTLWRYVSYQTAVDIARTERTDPMIAAQKLRDFAISYGAEESIMIMVLSVGDLFYKADHRSAGMTLSAQHAAEAAKKAGRRFREELPGDRTLARLDREVAPPIGQVALVFTDIKNSTSLWETNGGMQTAMRLHNYLLRRQLRIVGGYEVKTEGDAFMVSFPSVTSALLWTFQVQQQLMQEDWPQELLESEDGKEVYDASGELIHRGLSVRMGIHWGRPVCEADPITRRMDYFGPMVNRAARISGAADGGQIFASKDVIKELQGLLGTFDESSAANDNLTKTNEEIDEDEFRMLNPNVSRDVVLLRRMGFGISQIGERRLKGLETPEMLWLVYPKQLSGRQPQAKTDDAPNAAAAQVYEPTIQLLDIEEVKQVGILCLRLESLSNSTVFPGILEVQDTLPTSPAGGALRDRDPMESAPATSSNALVPLSHHARRKGVETLLNLHPELLIYSIRDDATDEELAGILAQLTTRIHNAISTLTLNVVRQKSSNGALDASTLELLSKMIATPIPPVAPIRSPSMRLIEMS